MPNPQLSADQFQRIARAICDPNRFQMLRTIYATPDINCGEMACDLPITAATASHHLRELEEAGLITVTRAGRFKKLAPRRDIWRAYMAQLRTL